MTKNILKELADLGIGRTQEPEPQSNLSDRAKIALSLELESQDDMMVRLQELIEQSSQVVEAIRELGFISEQLVEEISKIRYICERNDKI